MNIVGFVDENFILNYKIFLFINKSFLIFYISYVFAIAVQLKLNF